MNPLHLKSSHESHSTNRRNFIGQLLLAGAGFSVVGCGRKSGDAAADGWIQLFNGRNLDGWTPKIRYSEAGENPGDTFRVVDGLLSVVYEAQEYPTFEERFGHLFYERTFSHYRIRTEYRFVGEQVKGGPGWAIRNSGLMLHGQTPESMRVDQDFPVSIEAQILGEWNGSSFDNEPMYSRDKRRYERGAAFAPLHQFFLGYFSRRPMGGGGSRGIWKRNHPPLRQWNGSAFL